MLCEDIKSCKYLKRGKLKTVQRKYLTVQEVFHYLSLDMDYSYFITVSIVINTTTKILYVRKIWGNIYMSLR